MAPSLTQRWLCYYYYHSLFHFLFISLPLTLPCYMAPSLTQRWLCYYYYSLFHFLFISLPNQVW